MNVQVFSGVLLATLVIGALSQCQPGERHPECDATCIENQGSTAMLECCKRAGFKVGGCPDGRTVYCTNNNAINCPPQRTPACDITCIDGRGSADMIQCCKAHGFQSGGCPDGRSVYCTHQ